MKHFQLIMTAFSHESDRQIFYERIEGDSLAELYAKLLITNVALEKILQDIKIQLRDDDIPF